MIKVMRFLKRAEHLWLEEFTCWWLEEHAFDMAHHQSPRLRSYIVNVRTADSGLPAAAPDGFDWDGVTEQWFDSVEAYQAAYSMNPSPTRADTLAHTSRFARMVFTEKAFASAKMPEM
jgi:hypothetical protein